MSAIKHKTLDVSILSLPRDLRIRALKGMLGLSNERIAAEAGNIDPQAVGSAIKHPDAIARVDETLLDLAYKHLASMPASGE